MRAPHLVSALLFAGLLTGCGGEDDEPRADDESAAAAPAPADTTSSAPPSDQPLPSPPALLRAWKSDLQATETGRWTAEHGAWALSGLLSQTGAYDLDPVGVDITNEIDHGPGTNTVYAYRANDEGRWMQASDETYDLGRCWIDLDTPGFESMFGPSGVNQSPPAIDALFGATEPRAAGPDIALRADLATVLRVVGAQLGDYEPPAVGAHRTIILATVQDGAIDGWEADLRSVLRDAERAGYPIEGLQPADVAGAWLTIRFEESPAPLAVASPPERLVREFSEDDAEFEASLAGCGAKLGPPGTPA